MTRVQAALARLLTKGYQAAPRRPDNPSN